MSAIARARLVVSGAIALAGCLCAREVRAEDTPARTFPHLTGGGQMSIGLASYGRPGDMLLMAGLVGRIGAQLSPRWAVLAEPGVFGGMTGGRSASGGWVDPPLAAVMPYLGLVGAFRVLRWLELSAGPATAIEIGFPLDDRYAVFPRIGGTLQLAATVSPHGRRGAPPPRWLVVFGVRGLAMGGERGSLVAGSGVLFGVMGD